MINQELLTIKIDTPLKRELKSRAAKAGLTMAELASKIFIEYLAKQKNKNGFEKKD